MDDQNKKLTTQTPVTSNSDDSNLPATQQSIKVYEVDMWKVKGVKPGDATQAQRTIEALMKANLRTRLAAHGLEHQGYEIEKLTVNQSFSNLSGKVSEIAVSEDATAVYELVQKAALGPGAQVVEASIDDKSLVKTELINDLAEVRESGDMEDLLQRIEMTVVQRQEQPKQLEADTAPEELPVTSTNSIFNNWVTLDRK